jgi:hypothetical protein
MRIRQALTQLTPVRRQVIEKMQDLKSVEKSKTVRSMTHAKT